MKNTNYKAFLTALNRKNIQLMHPGLTGGIPVLRLFSRSCRIRSVERDLRARFLSRDLDRRFLSRGDLLRLGRCRSEELIKYKKL